MHHLSHLPFLFMDSLFYFIPTNLVQYLHADLHKKPYKNVWPFHIKVLVSVFIMSSIIHIHANSTYHLHMPNQVFLIELLSLDVNPQQQQQQQSMRLHMERGKYEQWRWGNTR